VRFAYQIDPLSSLIPSPHIHITKAISSITKGSQVSMDITLWGLGWFSILEETAGEFKNHARFERKCATFQA
jgi:ligand-binding SRPBCC domain-containing protein